MLQAANLGLVGRPTPEPAAPDAVPADAAPSDANGPDWPALKALGRPINLYFVRREDSVWRIVHDGHRAGAYATAEAALAYACKLARESAGLGYPSAVLKPAAPRAFHGFAPRGVTAG